MERWLVTVSGPDLGEAEQVLVRAGLFWESAQGSGPGVPPPGPIDRVRARVEAEGAAQAEDRVRAVLPEGCTVVAEPWRGY